ncbi:MAG: ligand-gated channel [Desulfuromonas sp.]|nr:MAG: ligand-gated channel [Desulfuromonas sp.]
MCHKPFFTVLVCSLLLPSFSVFAADTVILDEIVVRGTEQSSFSSNLTIREVKESAARDLGEALQNVPGMTYVRKGAIANDVVLRGLKKDNINVLLDGVRLYGGCPSRMDPPSFHFDFAEVESVEVVRGPYDLSHPGSLGGMVNAVSKSPAMGKKFNFSLTGGSFDMLHSSLTTSYGAEKYDILAGYAYKYSLPPESGDGKRITEVYTPGTPNSYLADKIDSRAYRINTGWAKAGYKFMDKGRSEISYSYQDAEHVLYPYLFMDADYDKTHRLSWTTRIEEKAGAFENSEIQLWWDRVDHLMSDRNRTSSLSKPRDYGMETDSQTSVSGVRANGVIKVGEGALKSGLDYYHRNWDATNSSVMYLSYQPQAMVPDVDIDNIGAFAEYSVPVAENLRLTTGGRVDRTTAEANALDANRLTTVYEQYNSSTNLDSETDFTEFGGNLQLTWTPRDSIEIFTGIASMTRTPDPQELYIGLVRLPTMMMPNPTSWVGNPDLDPVRNNQADIGFKMTADTLFLSGSLFYSDLDNYITLVEIADPDGGGTLYSKGRSYRNIDAEIVGGEISVQSSLPLDLFLTAALNYTRGENKDLDEPLAETPPLNGSVSLRYDLGTWFAEITERFADRQDRIATSLQELETAGWNITNIKGGYYFDNWSLIAGVDNLFDNYYFSHLSYQRDPYSSGVRVPETGRMAYLTISYSY